MEGGEKLGVEPMLAPHDMARPDVDHLGPMAYIARFQWIPHRKDLSSCIRVKSDLDNVRINNPVPFTVEYLSDEINKKEIKIRVTGPLSFPKVDVNLGSRVGKGSFTPKEIGVHELVVTYDDEPVEGSPLRVRVLPDISEIMLSGIGPCEMGSIVEVMINSNGTGKGTIDVVALAPSGRSLECPVKEESGTYAATFQPDEAGKWSIAVTYHGEHIQGSPFSCLVYDLSAMKVINLHDGPTSSVGREFTLVVDATACGEVNVDFDVVHDGRSIPSKTLPVQKSLYEVTFNPLEAAKYKIFAYINGREIKESPYILYLGMEPPPKRKSNKSKKSSRHKSQKEYEPIIKEYSSKIDSPVGYKDSVNIKDTRSGSLSRCTQIVKDIYDESDTKKYSSLNHNSSSLYSNKYSRDSLERTKYNTIDNSSSERHESSRIKISPSRSYESSSLSRLQKSRSPSDIRVNKGFEINPSPTERISGKLTVTGKLSSNSDSKYNSNYNYSQRHSSLFNSSSTTTMDERRITPERTFLPKLENYRDKSSKITNYSEHEIRSFPTMYESTLLNNSSPIGMPEERTGLSSPAKVLLATQNAVKTTEGSSFFYNSVANMKILPSTY